MLWKQVESVREHTPVTMPFCLASDSFIFVRQVRDSLKNTKPDDVPIPYNEVKNPCRMSHGYPNTDGANDAGAVHSLSTLVLLLTLALHTLITSTAF